MKYGLSSFRTEILSFPAEYCHSELVEESPASTTRFVRKTILSYNLIVSILALMLSFQIPRSLYSLGMTDRRCHWNDRVGIFIGMTVELTPNSKPLYIPAIFCVWAFIIMLSNSLAKF